MFDACLPIWFSFFLAFLIESICYCLLQIICNCSLCHETFLSLLLFHHFNEYLAQKKTAFEEFHPNWQRVNNGIIFVSDAKMNSESSVRFFHSVHPANASMSVAEEAVFLGWTIPNHVQGQAGALWIVNLRIIIIYWLKMMQVFDMASSEQRRKSVGNVCNLQSIIVIIMIINKVVYFPFQITKSHMS